MKVLKTNVQVLKTIYIYIYLYYVYACTDSKDTFAYILDCHVVLEWIVKLKIFFSRTGKQPLHAIRYMRQDIRWAR